MSDLSSNISKSFDLNDSDIEKQFAQIKNSNTNKNASTKTVNNSANNQLGNKSLVNPIKKSPKPIPKGIDFGENLIGNPRYFSKNNSPLNNSDEAKYSENNFNTSDGYEAHKPNNRNETWTRMDRNGETEEKDELISDSYTESNVDSNTGEDDEYSQHSETDENSKRYKNNYPNQKNGSNNNVSYNKYQNMTQSEIYAAKEEILLELEKLEDKGIRIDKKFTISSDLYEMERTYMRLKTKRDQTSAIKLMKKVLMGLVSGTEYINQKFNKDNIDLEGWAENVLLNITDYDEIFEELYDKYKSKFAVAPEIKLFMTLIGSAFTFHMSKVLASKFSAPNNYSTNNPPQNNYSPQQFNNNQTTPQFTNKQAPSNNPKQPNAPFSNNNRNINLSRNMSNIFGSESKNKNKNNNELDEIIREMEEKANANNLEIPDDDDEFNEILSDDNANEFTELNEIQTGKKSNLVL
jgi:hypothetical protein